MERKKNRARTDCTYQSFKFTKFIFNNPTFKNLFIVLIYKEILITKIFVKTKWGRKRRPFKCPSRQEYLILQQSILQSLKGMEVA